MVLKKLEKNNEGGGIQTPPWTSRVNIIHGCWWENLPYVLHTFRWYVYYQFKTLALMGYIFIYLGQKAKEKTRQVRNMNDS